MRQRLNYDICMAAGKDAGNRNMGEHNRSQWNIADWNVAAKISNKLINVMNKKQKAVKL